MRFVLLEEAKLDHFLAATWAKECDPPGRFTQEIYPPASELVRQVVIGADYPLVGEPGAENVLPFATKRLPKFHESPASPSGGVASPRPHNGLITGQGLLAALDV